MYINPGQRFQTQQMPGFKPQAVTFFWFCAVQASRLGSGFAAGPCHFFMSYSCLVELVRHSTCVRRIAKTVGCQWKRMLWEGFKMLQLG